eukprot:TRINITY_DN7872_c0_g1_i2.p1 TRINITY_DN7872_c0_g1~~TRINITY_DN7872_c0_g1_i2.p1  ORF type:complete len:723 (+),score=244.03 TRINITY_DN7872_c0_g1_i2:67-2235(+)
MHHGVEARRGSALGAGPPSAAAGLSDARRAALRALVDTFLPRLTDAELAQLLDGAAGRLAAPRASVEACLRASGTDAGLDAAVAEVLETHALAAPDEKDFLLLLDLLGSTVGTVALFATLATQPFAAMGRARREALLSSLARSALELRRKAFNGVKRLVLALSLSFVPRGAGANPYWPAVGYALPRRAEGAAPAWNEYDYRARALVDTASLKDGDELEYDVVVVGSGGGGGVAAAKLAEAGYRVVVAEKAAFQGPSDYDEGEAAAFKDLYERAGLLTTVDGAMTILAGAAFGGGTSVNWACCIPLPDRVREEWGAAAHGLPQFLPTPDGAEASDFDRALAAVMRRIGASADGVVHNRNNELLRDGCMRLGYPVRATAQNLKDTAAKSAGWTCFGDRYGNKQGGLYTYLLDAARAGCRFMEGCAVERVLMGPAAAGGTRRATGVVARVARCDGAPPITITLKARRAVVLAAGALHTPCVLLRSGMRNPHVGKHLRLHPVTGVTAKFFGDEVRAYEGAPMTTVSDVCADGPAGDYYGAKLEVPSTHPGLMAACLPWTSGLAAKQNFLDLNHAAAFIVLQRDKGEGHVALEPSDKMKPAVHYTLSRHDRESMIDAMQHAVRIFAASDPDEVATLHVQETSTAALRGAASEAEKTARVEAFNARIRARGLANHAAGLFSAHQMGTCRMGASPATSVIDKDGECWECDDLYIADASTFRLPPGQTRW